MWHKGVGSKIHRGRFDKDTVKLESTAVDVFRKVYMLLFQQNIAHLCLERRIYRVKKKKEKLAE